MKHFLKISFLALLLGAGANVFGAPSKAQKSPTISDDEKVGNAVTHILQDPAWEQLRAFAQNGEAASLRKAVKSFKPLSTLAKMNLTLSSQNKNDSLARFKTLLKDLKKLSQSKESAETIASQLITALTRLKACLFYLHTLLSKDNSPALEGINKATLIRLAALKIIQERQAELKK